MSTNGKAWKSKDGVTRDDGICHSFSDGGHKTDCGIEISGHGVWYVAYNDIGKVNCKNCITKTKKPFTLEEHIERHKVLHGELDELLADFIANTNSFHSKTTVFEFMKWASSQCKPETITHKESDDA